MMKINNLLSEDSKESTMRILSVILVVAGIVYVFIHNELTIPAMLITAGLGGKVCQKTVEKSNGGNIDMRVATIEKEISSIKDIVDEIKREVAEKYIELQNDIDVALNTICSGMDDEDEIRHR